MSTKKTILHGTKPNYHMYLEAFDKDNSIYLQMHGVGVEAAIDTISDTNGEQQVAVTVKIPRDVWNEIVLAGPIPPPEDDEGLL